MGDEYDLHFTHYRAGGDMPDDFMVTAISDRGVLWLADNMDTTSGVPEGQEGNPPGNAWADNKEDFDRLFNQAKADGISARLDIE